MKTLRASIFELHQAVHGYDEGHRLLRSSVKLSSDDARRMVILSDASGPGARISSCGYLTGYPLFESGMYALARTWSASEKERPGCVWTHSLLLDFADLAVIENLESILEFFDRPTDQTLNKFGKSLQVSLNEPVQLSILGSSEFLKKLVWTLYSNPYEPMTISSDSSAEQSILRIWSQQWPKLRRNFRFCTESFSDRSTRSIPFDVQVKATQLKKFKSKIRVGNGDSAIPEPSIWFEELISDLNLGTSRKSSLRNFLDNCGSELSGGREFVAPLSSVYGLLSQPSIDLECVEQLIEIVEKHFTEERAEYLRVSVVKCVIDFALRSEATTSTLEFAVSQLDLLLAEANNADFVESFALHLLNNHLPIFCSLLRATSLVTSKALEMISKLSLSDVIEKLNFIPTEDQITLINARPEVVEHPRFWQNRKFDSLGLRWLELHYQLSPGVIRALVEAERTDLLSFMLGAEGPTAILEVLVGMLAECKFVNHLEFWLRSCVADAHVLQQLLQTEDGVPTNFLFALSKISDADQRFPGSDPWTFAVAHRRYDHQCDTSGRQRLAAFCLRRSLGTSTEDVGTLVRESLDEIYLAAQQSILNQSAWALLEDRLPDLGFWTKWDKCKRIRFGIADLVLRKRMNAQAFLNVSESEQLFEELAEIISWRGADGQRYLREVLSRCSRSSRKRRLDYLQELL